MVPEHLTTQRRFLSTQKSGLLVFHDISKLAGQAGTHKRWAGLGVSVPRQLDVRYDIPDPALRALHEHRVDPGRVLCAVERQRRAWHSWQYDLKTAELDELLRQQRDGAVSGVAGAARANGEQGTR